MKILLVCSGGMSSAIIVKAVEKEAAKTDMPLEMKSVATGEVTDELIKGWDALLVAPQVRHRLSLFQEAAAPCGIPVILIPPQGYSPLGGQVILAEIKKVLAT